MINNPEDDLLYTSKKISDNFSNYSAIHYRTYYIKLLNKNPLNGMDELETINNAVFVEPNDQSSWMYLKWIIKYIQKNYPDQINEIFDKTEEICNNLLSIEPDSKWALYMLYYISKCKYLKGDKTLKEFCLNSLEKLIELDQLHMYIFLYF